MRYLILCLFCFQASASETWFCTETSTTRQGSTWNVCGLGEAMTEGEARDRALSNALSEFKALCKLSTSCQDMKTEVEPKRVTCAIQDGWWKCYRMLEITAY